MLVSLDIESACNVLGCPGTIDKCDHALSPYTSDISCIGLWTPADKFVLRDLSKFKNWVQETPEADFIGHNLKFDIKHLKAKGIDITAQYAEDTQIMSAVSLTKVSPEYMAWYSAAREKKNKEIGRTGGTHRAARGNSLKVLAPYFLKVEPFWENPKDHDSDEYVLKDCEYTYRLYEFFQAKLKEEGLTEFYQQLMSWTRMLTEAEIKGIKIDMDLVASKHSEAKEKSVNLEASLASAWAPHLIAYNQLQKDKIRDKYNLMYEIAKAKRRAKNVGAPDEVAEMELFLKYKKMEEKAALKDIEPFNFASPTQLKWLFKERLGLDITNFKDEESTGKEVLNRLTSEGHGDVALFLEYRKYSKLNTAFYPSYKEMQYASTIHCNFNPTGTRTGRLSSSGPNLQQVPGDLHQLFIARPGYKLITRDLSAIEPCLVAYYTQDPILCDLLIKGEHFHTQNAKVMFDLDRALTKAQVKEQFPRELAVAKTVGLAVIYGAGPFRVQQTGMQQGFNWHIGFCKEAVNRLKYEYQTAFEFKQGLDNYAVDHPIETLFGRKHRYEDPSEIYMKAFNTLIQSTASDLLLQGSYKAYDFFKYHGEDCYPLLWVHDEIVFECLEEEAEYAVTQLDDYLTNFKLETPYGNIPLKVEGKISDRWEK